MKTDVVDPKVRAKRVTLRLQMAANRSSWISATEAALYVHCEQSHCITHQEVPVFLSRVWFLMNECQRVLQGSRGTLLSAATVPITTIDYTCVRVKTSEIVANRDTTAVPLHATRSRANVAGTPHDDAHLVGATAPHHGARHNIPPCPAWPLLALNHQASLVIGTAPRQGRRQ